MPILYNNSPDLLPFAQKKELSTMATKATTRNTMRILHRYLGFFLAGIMAVYALSGVILIFRDTDFLKQDKPMEKTIEPNQPISEVGKAIKQNELKISSEDATIMAFAGGNYNKTTGLIKYTGRALPNMLEKLTHLHKAKTTDPLYYLNIFFGASLLFFVISSFWMFLPKTTIFKKGIYFTAAGVVLTIILLYA